MSRSGGAGRSAATPEGQHTMVAAAIRQAFVQTDAEMAHQTWRHIADQLRPRRPKLATLVDDREHDALPYRTYLATTLTEITQYFSSRALSGPLPKRRSR